MAKSLGKAEKQAEERIRIGNTPDELPPDPEEMNDERADAGGDTLYYFAQRYGEKGEGLDRQNAVDLLADLAHYADRNGLSMPDLWAAAKTHYDAETDGEGTQFESESEDEDED